mmetsp:Transcript_9011/g.28602  ORF Transcript_9011/g.28602 Transcript_9011/m.28602 type:complete len:99 (-) Transcript_9011:1991-2287(-)
MPQASVVCSIGSQLTVHVKHVDARATSESTLYQRMDQASLRCAKPHNQHVEDKHVVCARSCERIEPGSERQAGGGGEHLFIEASRDADCLRTRAWLSH